MWRAPLLSGDDPTIPVEEIGSLASLLTTIGERVVFAAGDDAVLADSGQS